MKEKDEKRKMITDIKFKRDCPQIRKYTVALPCWKFKTKKT